MQIKDITRECLTSRWSAKKQRKGTVSSRMFGQIIINMELKTTEMLYCVSKNHALAHEERITVPMIAKEKMVSTKHDHYKTEALRQIFLQAGYEEGPQVSWRYDQQSTALQMIAANMATGYFPAEAIRQNDGIVGKQLEGDKPVPICIAWTKDSWKQEEVQQFIKEIMKFYGAVR